MTEQQIAEIMRMADEYAVALETARSVQQCVAIDTARTALEQALRAVGAPKGWRLVPEEPTAAMLAVMVNVGSAKYGRTAADAYSLDGVWREMLAAAPPAPEVP